MVQGLNVGRCEFAEQEQLAAMQAKNRELAAKHNSLRTSITNILAVLPNTLTQNTTLSCRNDCLKNRIKNGKMISMIDLQTLKPPRQHVKRRLQEETTKRITEEEYLQSRVYAEDQTLQAFHDSILGCLQGQCNLDDTGFSDGVSVALTCILRDAVPEAYQISDDPSVSQNTTVSSTSRPVITGSSLSHLEHFSSNPESPSAALPGFDHCVRNVRAAPLPVGLVRTSAVYPSTFSDLHVPNSIDEDDFDMHTNSTSQITLTSEVLTLMIRNIPARFTASKLMEIWPAVGVYNILHLPYDHRTKRTSGVAFMNFVSHDAASSFWEQWHGQSLVEGGKGLSIAVAKIQGFDANINNMIGSKKILSIRNPDHMPIILQPDGIRMNFHDFIRT